MEAMKERQVHTQEAASPRGLQRNLVNTTAEQAKGFRVSAAPGGALGQFSSGHACMYMYVQCRASHMVTRQA